MNPFLEQIGERLRAERKGRGWSQARVAAQSGCTRQEISEIENGRFRGSVLKVQDYAMALGFTLALEMKRRPTLDELGEIFDED
jgi:transcriptional regulator with XRE-family HTH domain